MEIRSKEFAVRAEAAEAGPEDLEIINRLYALRALEADEVYVRRLALCNDQYDRTYERFPRAYLEKFAQTLPGKPLLAHHDRMQFPLGRFFRAEVQSETPPQTPTGAKASVSWLVCWVYLVKTPANEEIRRQIDAGVYSHVSIGYRWADLVCDLCARSYFRSECPHVIGQEYDGRSCTATYGGDEERVEAVEGSLVYLGAQYGAVVTKSDDRTEEKRVLLAKEAAVGEVDAVLAEEGRQYREALRREIVRLGRCVHAEHEAKLLVEAMANAPATRLSELMGDYRRRFDARYPRERGQEQNGEPAPPRASQIP